MKTEVKFCLFLVLLFTFAATVYGTECDSCLSTSDCDGSEFCRFLSDGLKCYQRQPYCYSTSEDMVCAETAGDATSCGCTDTDGGNYPKVFGTVRWDGNDYDDDCVGPNELAEAYCQAGLIEFEIVDCESRYGSDYVCEDGACLEVVPCTDSDGDDYYTEGYIIYDGDTYWDACADDWITEFICTDGSGDSIQYECPYGCSDGACQEEITCSDSDGIDYFNRGYVVYDDDTYWDACAGDWLTEQICTDGSGDSIQYECTYGCENGACLEYTPCSDSDGSDYYNEGYIVYQGETYWDGCAGDWLTEQICTDGSGDSIQYECPYGCSDGACIVECSDSDGSDYYNKGYIIYDSDTYWDACAGDWLTEFICTGGSGDSTQYECPYGCSDGACLEAEPCSDSDGLNFTQKGYIIYDSDTYWDACAGDWLTEQICTDGSGDSTQYECPHGCSDGVCLEFVPCTDSDGNDYYTEGYIIYNDETYWDGCAGDWLTEHICVGDSGDSTQYECPYGCFNGACNEFVPCSDSDGINYTLKGYIIYDGEEYWDACAWDWLTEFVCTGGSGDSIQYECPYGCTDGACDELAPCTDSDGSDYYTKGYIIYDGETYWDGCAGDWLTEHICTGGSGDSIQYECPYGCADDACLLECTDSDGVDYYTSGYIIYRGETYWDGCAGDWLTEHICTDGSGDSIQYECPYGCADDACLLECTDSDGVDYYTRGYIIYDGETYWDGCAGNWLTEHICTDGSGDSIQYECPYGCVDDACIMGCTDSDGIDYYQSGYIIYRGETYWDGCAGDWLTEHICTDGSGDSIQYECPYGCVDDACVNGCYNGVLDSEAGELQTSGTSLISDYGGFCGTCTDGIVNNDETKANYYGIGYDFGGHWCGFCDLTAEKDEVWISVVKEISSEPPPLPFNAELCVKVEETVAVVQFFAVVLMLVVLVAIFALLLLVLIPFIIIATKGIILTVAIVRRLGKVAGRITGKVAK